MRAILRNIVIAGQLIGLTGVAGGLATALVAIAQNAAASWHGGQADVVRIIPDAQAGQGDTHEACRYTHFCNGEMKTDTSGADGAL